MQHRLGSRVLSLHNSPFDALRISRCFFKFWTSRHVKHFFFLTLHFRDRKDAILAVRCSRPCGSHESRPAGEPTGGLGANNP